MGAKIMWSGRVAQDGAHIEDGAAVLCFHKHADCGLIGEHQRAKVKLHGFVPAVQGHFVEGTVAHFSSTSSCDMIQPIERSPFPDATRDGLGGSVFLGSI